MIQVITKDRFIDYMKSVKEDNYTVEGFETHGGYTSAVWSGIDYDIWSKVFDYLEQYDNTYEFDASDVYEAVNVYDGIADFDSHHPHDYGTCQICSNLEEGEVLEPEDFIQHHLELYPIDSYLIKVKYDNSYKYVVIEHDRL